MVELHLLYRSITKEKSRIVHHTTEDLPWLNDSNN
jgi:hypothetical protein